MNFVDREHELKFLEDVHARPGFQFVPIYGRRRIGKTRLVREFIRGKKAVYYLADSASTREQLKNLGRALGDFFGDILPAEAGFQDWAQAFRYVRDKAAGRLVWVIDEFPYLVNAEPAASSIFQKGIEEHLKTSGIFLILMGSSVGMMEREVLAYKAPLYGRRTGSLKLTEMKFGALRGFFPAKSFEELARIFSVFGTVPAYLELLDPHESVLGNVDAQILRTGTYLSNEVEYLLREELREPRQYFVILRAMAQGKRRMSEIGNETGLDKSHVARYLDILQSLQVVEREVPATERNPDKSRHGLYRIKDKYIGFWFKYVYPNRSLIEIGRSADALRIIRQTFEEHVAAAYEDICRELVPGLFEDSSLSFSSVGRWWSKDGEIDVVALDEERKHLLLGECKWSRKKVGEDIYESLKRKSELVDWHRPDRRVTYALFSRSGFTEGLRRRARDGQAVLVHGDKWVG
jgi:uncharacterized protein